MNDDCCCSWRQGHDVSRGHSAGAARFDGTRPATQEGSSTLDFRSLNRSRRPAKDSRAQGFSIYKRQLQRQQKQEQSVAARAATIRMHRGATIRLGELPDIQAVSLQSLLAPLVSVASRRPPVAAKLLAALLAALLQAGDQSQLLQVPLAELRCALADAFAASLRSPACVDALQQLAAADQRVWIGPRQLLEAAGTSGGLGAAVVQLEEQMMYSGAAAAAAGSSALHPLHPRLRVSGDADNLEMAEAAAQGSVAAAAAAEPPGCWRVLADLYQQLASPDLLELVRTAHLVRCQGTLRALAEAAAGRHEYARRLYERILEERDALEEQQQQGQPASDVSSRFPLLAPGGLPSKYEEGLIFGERLRCFVMLGKWQVIQEQVEADLMPAAEDDADDAAMAATDGPDLSTLFTSPDKDVREQLLPYMQACLFNGAAGDQALLCSADGLLNVAGRHRAWRWQLQQAAGVEMAVVQLLAGSVESSKAALADTLRLFCSLWSSTAPSSLSALQAAAANLQPAAELEEQLRLLRLLQAQQHPAATLAQQQLAPWRSRWPAVYSSNDGGQVVRVLELRCKLLQTLAGRSDLQAALAGLRAELQLQAGRTLTAHRCIDMAQELLNKQAGDLVALEQSGSAQLAALAAELRSVAVLASAELSVRRAEISPRDAGSIRLLDDSLQKLQRLKQQQPRPGLQVSLHVTTAVAASTLARLAADTAGGTAAAKAQALNNAAVTDFSSAIQLLSSQGSSAAAAAGAGLGRSSDLLLSAAGTGCSLGSVQLQFGLLCSQLHQQQVDAQQQRHESSLLEPAQPAAAAAAADASVGLAALAVQHLLGAMAAGGNSAAEAWLHVPTVLAAMAGPGAAAGTGHVAVQPPSAAAACAAFGAGWRAVPLHILLPWVSQLLARLGDWEGQVLVEPLEELAARIPQRVYLPFSLSQQHWLRKSGQGAAASAASQALSRSQQLAASLSGPGLAEMRAFVAALDELTFPSQRVAAWAGLLTSAAAALAAAGAGKAGAKQQQGSQQQQQQREGLVRLWRDEVWPDIVGKFQQSAAAAGVSFRSSSRSAAAAGGSRATINEEFAQQVASEAAAAFGEQGQRLGSITPLQLQQAVMKLLARACSHPSSDHKGLIALDRMSGWFGRFGEAEGSHGIAPRLPLLMPKMLSVANSGSFAAELSAASAAAGAAATSSSDSSAAGSGFVLADGQRPVEVVGFGKRAHVYDSKQKPKLLTIYGSDFREHQFVVKGGEDVRLDEHIQQLFVVLSRLAQTHSGCVARGLHAALSTFDVVPASPRLGLLAFVQGTAPMGSLIEGSLPKDLLLQLQVQFVRGFPHTAADAANFLQPYAKAWTDRSDAAMIKNLRATEAHIPWDALRRVLFLSAAAPDAWLAKRQLYTWSLAAASTWGYLLGLGDRHLANLLVVRSSGAVVPIDFGYSFGTAVLALPVVELPPFRLTRQLANVLQPHDAAALLQPGMTALMESAMEGRRVLESVMQVFLAEPLGEWQRESAALSKLVEEAAAAAAAPPGDAGGGSSSAGAPGDDSGEQQPPPTKRQRGSSAPAAAGGGRGATGAAGAAPRLEESQVAQLKVNQIRQRLEGHNPAGIIAAEAKANGATAKIWPQMEAVIAGRHDASCHRGRLPATGPCPGGAADVARVLLELATDEAILGRCYAGWRPFV